MCGSAVRMGAHSAVVYTANGILRSRSSQLRISGIRLFGRFSIRPRGQGSPDPLSDCKGTTKKIDRLLKKLGLTRHPSKGEWSGSHFIEHLGVTIDSVQMNFFIAEKKLIKVRELVKAMLREVRFGRRWVSRKKGRPLLRCMRLLNPAHSVGPIPHARYLLLLLFITSFRCEGSNPPHAS